jgi:hypothetical protein
MRRPLRIALLVALGLILAAVAALLAAYQAARHVPAFYAEALAADTDPQTLAARSDRLLQRASALHEDLLRKGAWHAVFTADEINSWLAVDVPDNHPDLLPGGFHDPRVRIDPRGITIACRAERRGLESVVSLDIDLYVDSPNVVALRVRRARVGAIPWSLKQVLATLAEAARRSQLHVDWRQASGDPVLRISIPPVKGGHGKAVRIDTIELQPGAVSIAGTTEEKK